VTAIRKAAIWISRPRVRPVRLDVEWTPRQLAKMIDALASIGVTAAVCGSGEQPSAIRRENLPRIGSPQGQARPAVTGAMRGKAARGRCSQAASR
jgi:hypothetical protein